MENEPFEFFTSVKLLEATGRIARNQKELLTALKEIDEATLFNHTHHFILQHNYLTPEPPSGFASWVNEALQDPVLAEHLFAVNTMDFESLGELRTALIETIESHLSSSDHNRDAPEGMEFHFIRVHSYTVPAGVSATTIAELASNLEQVSSNSIYHHMFEARLRLGRQQNDFSNWLTYVGDKKVADQIASLDPYLYSLDELRRRIIILLRSRS
ncbi:MAG: DUF5752 family protein [Planctomycetota bacterium]|jgi:hypothetical protein|nr:DUF5752 family protein [Planctomycetota bacterium]